MGSNETEMIDRRPLRDASSQMLWNMVLATAFDWRPRFAEDRHGGGAALFELTERGWERLFRKR